MPYQSKITTDEQREQVEQAMKQHYIIDDAGRFSTSPVCLEYMYQCERQEIPYLIARMNGKYCDVYLDMPGKYKWTEEGFKMMLTLFKQEETRGIKNGTCAYRVTSDNAQFEGLASIHLPAFAELVFAVASEYRSLEQVDRNTMRKLQKLNSAVGKDMHW